MRKKLGDYDALLTKDGWRSTRRWAFEPSDVGLLAILVFLALLMGVVIFDIRVEGQHMARQRDAIKQCLDKGGRPSAAIDGRRAYIYCDGVKAAP